VEVDAAILRLQFPGHETCTKRRVDRLLKCFAFKVVNNARLSNSRIPQQNDFESRNVPSGFQSSNRRTDPNEDGGLDNVHWLSG
jgi:hypothetical protein